MGDRSDRWPRPRRARLRLARSTTSIAGTARGLPLCARRAREPRGCRGRDADDVPERVPGARAGVRPRKPSNWLLTIASNAIKQRFRQESSSPRQVELDDRIAGTSAEEERATVGEILVALSRNPAAAAPGDRAARVRGTLVQGDRRDPRRHHVRARDAPLPREAFAGRGARAPPLLHRGPARRLAGNGRPARAEGAAQVAGASRRVPRLRPLRAHPAASSRRASWPWLIPVPVSLSLFKGLEGSAAAATLPAVGIGAAAATSGVGAAGATGGGILAGGVALKAAAVVTAATVATGGVVGATEVSAGKGPNSPAPARLVKPGKSAHRTGPRGVERPGARKADAPGQARARGGPAPGQIRKAGQAAGLGEAQRPRKREIARQGVGDPSARPASRSSREEAADRGEGPAPRTIRRTRPGCRPRRSGDGPRRQAREGRGQRQVGIKDT